MADSAALFSLHGMRIVVAGASRGIGYGIARGLGQAGAEVTGFGRSVGVRAEGFEYLACDLNDSDEINALFDRLDGSDNPIAAYLHVAGITTPTTGGMQSVGDFAETLNNNLTNAYRCCANVGQRMAARGGGSIVTVTSIGSVQGFPNNPGYVAAKGGLRMMSKALALDLGPSGVRVNCLVPGYIQTDMTAGSFKDPVLNQQRAARTMLGRWGQVDDLIGAAIFLASPASSYVTGSDLFVDGGWTAKGL
jgi:NAD(P)-dependent dehydrogenase (short-subunit alcohol dehydrogenase family)